MCCAKIIVMRKLKFVLNRDKLHQIYETFIIPHNFSQINSHRLNIMQNEALCIVTAQSQYALDIKKPAWGNFGCVATIF